VSISASAAPIRAAPKFVAPQPGETSASLALTSAARASGDVAVQSPKLSNGRLSRANVNTAT
jgi:hypothetical protein